jgi:hypothetical protein
MTPSPLLLLLVVLFRHLVDATLGTIKTVADGATALDMANAMLGSGGSLTILDATYTGAGIASGIIDSTGFPADHYLKSTFANGAVVLTSGSALLATDDVNSSGSSSTNNGLPGNDQLSLLGYDASILVITLKATSLGKLVFKYAFGSEEYPEFVGSQYNDVFKLFVDGVNVARIPGTTTEVSINTVNGGANSAFYSEPSAGIA